MAHKVKALQQWCKVRCEGYRDVEITNMTSSWKSGLAFCAIIHRYRPDIIDYDSLKKEDTYGNSKYAFDVALNELGIAALLDPEDMVAMTVPDKLCIVTYVAQYYNYFHDKPQLGGPNVKTTVAVKRPLRMADVYPPPEPTKPLTEITNKPNAVAASEKQNSPAAKRRTIEDRCCMCREKVYLLERHYSGGMLYHRHCCREAERSSTLKRNKENFGTSSDKKESPMSGNQSKVDANKNPSIFAKGTSPLKIEPVTEPVSKPASTGLLKALLVPSRYKSDSSEVVPVVSSTPSPASNLSSPYKGLTSGNTSTSSVPWLSKDTSSASDRYTPPKTLTVTTSYPTSVTNATVTSPVISSVRPGASLNVTSNISTTTSHLNKPNYSTPSVKPSALGTTTSSAFSNLFGKKSPTPVSTGASNLNPPRIISTTTLVTTVASSVTPSSTTKSSSSSSAPWLSPPPVTTSAGVPKYTAGIFEKRTTTAGAATSVSPAVSPSGYTSTITTNVSNSPSPRLLKTHDSKSATPVTSSPNVVPNFQLGSGNIAFTFKYSDDKNAAMPVSPNDRKSPSVTAGGNVAMSSNVHGSTLVTKGSSALAPGGKVNVELSETGKTDNGSSKTEWQLEAERRQAARNGAYVDPEKNPRHFVGKKADANTVVLPVVQQPNSANSKESGTKKVESFPKGEDTKSGARDGLIKILQKQLHPTKEAVGLPPTPRIETTSPGEASKSPVKGSFPDVDEQTWVIVEKPGPEYQDHFSRSPAFHGKDEKLPSEVPSPPQHPEKFKKIVEEGTIGFSTNDRTVEAALPHFESSPPLFPKERRKVVNPLIPKRKVNAEEKVSVDQINKKLVSLDQKLRVVEMKGRELEDKIRDVTDEAMDEEEDELMLQWFNLVKQKYELVREETDLMYRRRAQELEALHEELEYQYRCLPSKPDDEKTFSEKQYEEELLKEILEVVKLRDNIVDSIEDDRKKYLEQDKKLDTMMEASGVSAAGKGKKKRKKNKKKNHQFPEKESPQRRLSFWKKSPKSVPAKE